MDGYEVYRQYIAIKMHFSGQFDYFKYNGKIKSKYSHYENRRDKVFFDVVARKLKTNEVVPFMVANFAHNDAMWIGDMVEDYDGAHEVYVNWKKKMLSLYQIYEEDLVNMVEFLNEKKLDLKDLFVYNDTHPLIFRFMIQGMIEKETFILLDDLINFIDRDNKKDDIIWNDQINRINRFRRFVPYDRSKVMNITKSILIP